MQNKLLMLITDTTFLYQRLLDLEIFFIEV